MAAEENNHFLESTLFRVKVQLLEKHKEQIREIISKQKLEKEDLLKNIKELSNCIQEESLSFQRELKSLKSLRTYKQKCIVEMSQKVTTSNAELHREEAELSSEIQSLRRQLKNTRENLKLKLHVANDEHNHYKSKCELEKKDLLKIITGMMEKRTDSQRTIESSSCKWKISRLHDDVEDALIVNNRIKTRKLDLKYVDLDTEVMIKRSCISSNMCTWNRTSSPFSLLSLIIFIILHILRKLVGLCYTYLN